MTLMNCLEKDRDEPADEARQEKDPDQLEDGTRQVHGPGEKELRCAHPCALPLVLVDHEDGPKWKSGTGLII